MEPSAVRSRLLRDHARLRCRLRELERAVVARQADPSSLLAIVPLARSLLIELIAHTEGEDAILAPALRESDAWGSIRAARLLEHHASQREQLRRLVEVYASAREATRLSQLTLAWIYDVEADMTHEETSVLNAIVLRDDLVAVGMQCS